MAEKILEIVVIGLSLSSSWGNGHATTYRSLLKALAARGHRITFLEREQPWYAENRDFDNPPWCRLAYYSSLAALQAWTRTIMAADAVIVGSYVLEGIAVGTYVQRIARGVTAFYDIDTPVTLSLLAKGDCAYLTPDLVAGYDLYLSFTGGPVLDFIEDRYGAPVARALYCSADTEFYTPATTPKRWDLSYLGTYSADRQPALERMLIAPARRLPKMRFVVAGPQYPDSIGWPENVERIEHVAPSDHPAFYGASRWTLNVTRADMVKAGYSPSVRLFEAAACATPVISDRWPGLDTIFEDRRSIMLASGTRDVLRVLTMPSPDAIGRAARTVIEDGHSAAHRAAELEAHLQEAAAAKARLEFARAGAGS